MLGLSRKRRHEKHGRELTAADTAEAEQRLYELVRDRMLGAVGPGAIWTVALRRTNDADAFFSQTIAETLARDIAGQLLGHPISPAVVGGIDTVAADADSAVMLAERHAVEPAIAELVRLVA